MEEKRVLFPKGNQKKLIRLAWKKSGVSWRAFSGMLGINYNTLQSYYYERTRLSAPDMEKIKKAAPLGEAIRKLGGKPGIWKPQNAFKNRKPTLGETRVKVGEPAITFRRAPCELSVNKNAFSSFDIKKGVKLPEKIDALLAEETGIHLGDGYLSERRCEFRVKGDKKEEKEYYDNFIRKLYKRLYNIDLNIREYETTYGFELSSKAVWRFKKDALGIKPGRKDDIAVPEKFKVNDKDILSALIRGFFDTDGCIYFRSQNKNRRYYPVISAASKSGRLASDLVQILAMLGFNAKMHKQRGCYSIVMNGYANFKKYNELIGWNSPKHLNKIKQWGERNPEMAGKYMVVVV